MRDHLLSLIFLCLFTLSGCANMTANIDPSYKPAPGSTSPLQSIKPLHVMLEVEDQRPASEQDRIGDRRGGFGNVMAGVSSNRSAILIVQDALATEFKNNGHALADKQSTGVDRIVRVILKKCWTENRVNFFDVSVMGSVVSDVMVIDPRNTNVLVSRPVTGTSTEGYQFATTNTYEDALNKALLEFVRSFSRDPQILQALNTTNP